MGVERYMTPEQITEVAAEQLAKGFGFDYALLVLKHGLKVARRGWNGKGMFLLLIDPYLNGQYAVRELPEIVGTLSPYIAMKTADNKLVPWLASQTDMLAEDWTVVE